MTAEVTSTTRPPTSIVRPERLLRRARTPHGRAGFVARVARRGIEELLARMHADELLVTDLDGTTRRYGPASRLDADPGADYPRSGDERPVLEPLSARLTVTDDRAWAAVGTEGSIGLGRGYIEGWWTSDDPTTVVRVLTRNLRPLDELRNRIEAVTGGVGDRIRHLLPRPGRDRNREDIAAHYDLGNEFFATFLDDTMTYSSAVFEAPTADLAAASVAKYDRLLAKLDVGPADRLLEIGTGWGGLALRAARSIGCHVTTTTVSVEQRREAIARAAGAGLGDRISVLGEDWRDLSGRYDRIVSIEMIEAVDWRDYEQYFSAIARCLASDGLVGLQAICVPDRRWNRTKNTEDFIRRFVFPGGYLPSLGSINEAVTRATRLQIVDLEDLSAHYAETLQRWRDRFDANLDRVTALGLDERFCRLWRFYLAYCEAGFRERHCTVNQLVLAGPDWRPDRLALRPH